MIKREQHRARYIEGWNTMNAHMLMSSITANFIFDDPAEPAPITHAELVEYMPVWPEKAAKLGGKFDFHIVDKVIQDKDGNLLEWYAWTMTGTDVQGTAQIITTDEGVMLERLSYFRTPWQLLR